MGLHRGVRKRVEEVWEGICRRGYRVVTFPSREGKANVTTRDKNWRAQDQSIFTMHSSSANSSQSSTNSPAELRPRVCAWD